MCLKHMKIKSTSLKIMYMNIKTTLKYYLSIIKLAKSKCLTA